MTRARKLEYPTQQTISCAACPGPPEKNPFPKRFAFQPREEDAAGTHLPGPEKYKGWFIPLKFTIFRQAEGKPVLTSLRCQSGVRKCPLEILSFLVCSFILLFVPVLSSVTCYFVEIL
ncbi:hypothetical protein AVEN_179592-1 [Araneus ventricosus]|uniref:Uncharacterized protein n=1 Tax=Araneus ventricosus TaxID=182803 RepID=A0A4Y2BFA7_ARAVE|nr:hypothetical protein AVEN_179592-1 [Araneus ventricosus]